MQHARKTNIYSKNSQIFSTLYFWCVFSALTHNWPFCFRTLSAPDSLAILLVCFLWMDFPTTTTTTTATATRADRPSRKLMHHPHFVFTFYLNFNLNLNHTNTHTLPLPRFVSPRLQPIKTAWVSETVSKTLFSNWQRQRKTTSTRVRASWTFEPAVCQACGFYLLC